MSATAPATPEQLLARFGLSSFRPGQREAVQAALGGRDSLVVMPTGAGKSLCYQLPALADVGLVLVVSPLIALMDDQHRRLRAAGVRATMLASSAEPAANAQALREIASGTAQLALVAPERFASRPFREALSQRPVGLFVVDEAHCVAEWGHDFRPDYLRLRSAIEALGRPPVMASTATATKRVAAEIAGRLGLRDWVSVSSGFDRPSLSFDVVGFEGEGALSRKRAALAHALADPACRPAIVYCGTRKDTEQLAEEIAGWGIPAVSYHAGMAPQRRAEAQQAFMSGHAQAIVATNAFGMGIDKADVRTVAHWAIPTSLEAYYQEAGRGGRDGLPARALLLASRVDLGRLIRFNAERDITVEEVRAFVGRLRGGARRDQPDGEGRRDGLDRSEGAQAPGGSQDRTQAAREGVRVEIGSRELDDRGRLLLSIAERAGAAVLQPGGGGSLHVELTGKGSSQAAHQAIKAAKDRGWESYRSIERFTANSHTCRRRQILDHFGDSSPGAPDGRCCDVCDPDPELQAAASRPLGRGRRRARVSAVAQGAIPAAGDGHPVPVERRERLAPESATRRRPSIATAEAPLEGADVERFERLRAWRLDRAEGKPAFTVATDAVLREVLRTRPSSEQGLLGVKGIGPSFCAKHGESLLAQLDAIWS